VCDVFLRQLPLADGFEWGRYVFEQIPLLALPFVPLFPVMSFLNAPFVSFGIFIFLFSFVARNPEYSRFVRFNTLQAIYLDIALIFPQLFKSIMGATGGLPSEIGVPLTNTVFYAMIFSVTYSLFKNVQGQTPNEIPLISESVRWLPSPLRRLSLSLSLSLSFSSSLPPFPLFCFSTIRSVRLSSIPPCAHLVTKESGSVFETLRILARPGLADFMPKTRRYRQMQHACLLVV